MGIYVSKIMAIIMVDFIDKLQPIKFISNNKLYTIDDTVVVSKLLSAIAIHFVSKSSNSKNYENNEIQRKIINIVTAIQAMSTLQGIKQLVESVDGIDNATIEPVGKLKDFANK